jgi:hypothetical protein
MSSKRRVRKHLCTNKVRHASREAAHRETERLHREDGRSYSPYFCTICNWWHNGKDDIAGSFPHGGKYTHGRAA